MMAIGFVGCEYDDSEIWNEMGSLKDRVVTLEQLCQQMNTNISAMQALVNALQNNDYITSVTPISQGNDVIGYTINFTKGESITIYHGKDGADGQDGQNGADGNDGYTPVIGVEKAEDGIYYWTLDGEWMTDAEGNKIPATGKDGADGADGAAGESGVTPELKIQDDYWYVSYDGGVNWERLGRAKGYDGADGTDGPKGDKGDKGADGDAFFSDVVDGGDSWIFILVDGTEIRLPKYQEFSVALNNPSANYVVVGASNSITINYTVTGCNDPTVLVVSDLDASVSNGAITVKAPATKGNLDAVEAVTLMVSNGSTTVMQSVDIAVADLFVESAANLDAALSNSSVSTVLLGTGIYTLDLYTGSHAKSALNIIGTSGTQVKFVKSQVRLEIYDQFTIRNCEVLRMPDKSWGLMVFSTGKANGVYTVDNCTFNGIGTQGIYINETHSSAVYNITNCTFNGDFGIEGAITIQGNTGVNQAVNIKGCTFNNIPSTSHKICIVRPSVNEVPYRTNQLNTDLAESDIFVMQYQ